MLTFIKRSLISKAEVILAANGFSFPVNYLKQAGSLNIQIFKSIKGDIHFLVYKKVSSNYDLWQKRYIRTHLLRMIPFIIIYMLPLGILLVLILIKKIPKYAPHYFKFKEDYEIQLTKQFIKRQHLIQKQNLSLRQQSILFGKQGFQKTFYQSKIQFFVNLADRINQLKIHRLKTLIKQQDNYGGTNFSRQMCLQRGMKDPLDFSNIQ